MDLVGKRVVHKIPMAQRSLGEGTIVESSANSIKVKFDAIEEIKSFIYPACFNKLQLQMLEIMDGELLTREIKQHEDDVREKSFRAEMSARAETFASEYKFAINPVIIIDKKIVWFGEPDSNANFKSDGHVLQTYYRPIIRFEGNYTAKALYGFLNMNKTVAQNSLLELSISENADNFACYVAKNLKCDKCGKHMELKKSPKTGKFFVACSDKVNCSNTGLVDVDLVDRYLYRNSRAGQRCPQDNTSLEGALSKYGVYVRCNGVMRHNYRLDEI